MNFANNPANELASVMSPESRGVPLPRRLAVHLAGLDLPQGSHLSEQALADAMGVSRTPIRRALAEFERIGIVQGQPNRGYFLTQASRSLFMSGLEFAIAGEDDLFDRITADRLSGQLGDTFTSREIVARYQVSTRLAQRSLQALCDENVIDVSEKDRWTFNPGLMTVEANDASYAFRLTIEPRIPLLPTFEPRRDLIRRCRDEHMRFLLLTVRERTGRLAFRVDAMFHEMLAECSRNPFFIQSVAQQNRLRQLSEYRDAANDDRVVAWVGEHLDILEAVTAGELQEASGLIEKHLKNALAQRHPKPADDMRIRHAVERLNAQ